MDANQMDLHDALKKYFGFSQFKGLQEQVIRNILNMKNTFVIMPTGGGKSLCYQLPALMKEGTAIVVSPLIALMKNQVDTIRGISEKQGVAHVLNSSLNKTGIARVKEDITGGITKLLYVAPESLTKEEYLKFLKSQKISFVAIDEAHCISEWGHNFRPEYRNLKKIIESIKNVPIVCLTATVTEKVQEDILKTLDITDAKIYKDSFNRPNLFYEVRPKTKNIYKDIIKFVRKYKNKSGVIYCLSRKKVEEVAQTLKVNNIQALPYHAGLNAQTRAKHQDMFLTEQVHIIVATIAFGMGIDKPDIRFVIHHDIPKSLESYYQETGRAGRDGGEGYCLAYYAYKDIEKLEKFMSNKLIAEKEIGCALLQDVVGYAETSMSRRKYLLHYFGEEFDEVNGLGANMDDNTRNPKPRVPAEKEVKMLLEVIEQTCESYKSKDIVAIMIGKENAMLKSHKVTNKSFFGIGKSHVKEFWIALIRQVLVANYIRKEIEQYGVLKLTQKGMEYIENPTPFFMTKGHIYDQDNADNTIELLDNFGSIDDKLMRLLKNLKKKIGKKEDVPPYAIFQDTSLESMCLRYPVTVEELSNIYGVGEGKAKKYGQEFVDLIADYVEENDIIRFNDSMVKGIGEKSGLKLYIIQGTDRKIPLSDIAKAKGLQMLELIKEIETIVCSGTKLDISYYIDSLLYEDQQQEIIDYFTESQTDTIQEALQEALEKFDEYEEEELRLMHIRFMNEVAN